MFESASATARLPPAPAGSRRLRPGCCKNRLGFVWVSRMNPPGFYETAPAPKPTPGQWMRAVLAINSEALHNRCSSVARPLPNRCATVKAPLQQQGVRVTRTLDLCVPAARTGAYLGTPSAQEFSSRCAILRSRLLLGINSSDSASSRFGPCRPCPASAPGVLREIFPATAKPPFQTRPFKSAASASIAMHSAQKRRILDSQPFTVPVPGGGYGLTVAASAPAWP